MNPELWNKIGPELLPAFWVTIKLAIASAIGSLAFDTLLTAMRVSPVGILCILSAWYVNIVRDTPLTLIVLLVLVDLYYSLSLLLATENDSFIAKQNSRLAVLAFVAYTSCFVAESLRAGINTVSFGQAEAARSLGLNFGQSFRYIIFPQVFRDAIVPLGNTLIMLTKNTTIASVIGVTEASLLMKTMTGNYVSGILIIFGIIAIDFITLTLPIGLFFDWTGKRWAVRR